MVIDSENNEVFGYQSIVTLFLRFVQSADVYKFIVLIHDFAWKVFLLARNVSGVENYGVKAVDG